MTPTTDLQKLCRDYDPEATEYENILSEAQWRRRNHDRQRGAIRHMGPDEKMHVEYWTWIVTNELAAARVLELEAENKRLREGLIWIEDCCTITSASEYINIIESCRAVAQRELRKGKS